jgi:hypothetical protein
MRRTERTKTVVVNQADLQDIKTQNRVKIQEENIFKTLKGFIQTKLSISEELADEVVKRIFDLIDAVEKETSAEECKLDTLKQVSKLKSEASVPIEPKSLSLTYINQINSNSITAIPPEVINSTIKVQDLAQSFENVVDGVLVQESCSTTNVSICKSEIIQERTFNFQNLIKMFEMK